jgi:hypothetical protein
MNVSKQLKKVAVHINQQRVVAILEKMTCGVKVTLDRASKPRSHSLHQLTQRSIGDLNKQVNVVSHPTIGVYTSARFNERLRHDFIEQLPIAVFEEDVLAMITARGDVVHRARNM